MRTLRQQPGYFGVWAIFVPTDSATIRGAAGPRVCSFRLPKNGALVFEYDDYQVDRDRDYYLVPKQRKQESIIEPYTDPRRAHVLMSSLAFRWFPKLSHRVAGVDVELASLSEQS